MLSQYRLTQIGVLAVFALAVGACALPVRVNSYVDRGADLSRYHTYDFAPVESVSTGDPRLDSNPFFNDRLRTAVEKELGARGYERTTSGTPDFRVHFHTRVTQEVDVNDIDRRQGYCADRDCTPFVYDQGTLLVDLVDAGTNKLVWRGWAESNINGVVDNQSWMERRVDAAIARIIATMPRPS